MKTWGSLVSANASPDRLRQTDDRQTRNLVEKKHAPLTYDATTITSNLVLLYNAHRHKLDPLTTHGMTNPMPAAHKPRNQPTNTPYCAACRPARVWSVVTGAGC